MSAQRRLQVLLGHLTAVPAERPSTTPSVRAESSVKAASGSGVRSGFRDLNAQINAFKRTLPQPPKPAPIKSKL